MMKRDRHYYEGDATRLVVVAMTFLALLFTYLYVVGV
jgi:hypothetical protein